MAKSPDAFRTIREVSEWLETPAHVLRFWESRFSQIKPVKRAGGRRYYRPTDMLLIGGIKKLLHQEGMTIKGVSKMLRTDGIQAVQDLSQPLDGETDSAVIDATTIPTSTEELTDQTTPPGYLKAVPESVSSEQQPVETSEIAAESQATHRPGFFSEPSPGMPFKTSDTSDKSDVASEQEPIVEFRHAQAKPEAEAPAVQVPIIAEVADDPADDAPMTAPEPLLALLFSAAPSDLAAVLPALQSGINQLEALRAKQVAG